MTPQQSNPFRSPFDHFLTESRYSWSPWMLRKWASDIAAIGYLIQHMDVDVAVAAGRRSFGYGWPFHSFSLLIPDLWIIFTSLTSISTRIRIGCYEDVAIWGGGSCHGFSPGWLGFLHDHLRSMLAACGLASWQRRVLLVARVLLS